MKSFRRYCSRYFGLTISQKGVQCNIDFIFSTAVIFFLNCCQNLLNGFPACLLKVPRILVTVHLRNCAFRKCAFFQQLLLVRYYFIFHHSQCPSCKRRVTNYRNFERRIVQGRVVLKNIYHIRNYNDGMFKDSSQYLTLYVPYSFTCIPPFLCSEASA